MLHSPGSRVCSFLYCDLTPIGAGASRFLFCDTLAEVVETFTPTGGAEGDGDWSL